MREPRQQAMMQRHLLGQRIVATMLALIIPCSIVSSIGAQQIAVPIEAQLPLFLKIVGFARSLEERIGDEFVLGVVYQGRYRRSRTVSDALFDQASQGEIEVLGRAVRLVPIDLDEWNLTAALKQKQVDMVYVAPLRAVDIESLASTCSSAGCATVTGVPEYVEVGLAIGLELQQERPHIVVNREAAQDQQLDLDPRLLRMCRIIEE